MHSGLRLAELRGHHGKGHTLAQALNDIRYEAAYLRFLPGILNWDEDFGDQEFRFTQPSSLGGQKFIHLSFWNICLFPKHATQEPCPADLCTDLIIKHARLDPGAAQILHHAARW